MWASSKWNNELNEFRQKGQITYISQVTYRIDRVKERERKNRYHNDAHKFFGTPKSHPFFKVNLLYGTNLVIKKSVDCKRILSLFSCHITKSNAAVSRWTKWKKKNERKTTTEKEELLLSVDRRMGGFSCLVL